MVRPPEDLRPLFWDMRFESLGEPRFRSLVVARIAEYGTDRAVRWLQESCTPAEIAAGLEEQPSSLSARTLSLWRLWLGKPEEWCRTSPSRPLKGRFWKH